MSNEILTSLTRDNPLLSRPTMGGEGVSHFRAINVTGGLPPHVGALIRESLSGNTQRAYQSDLGEFERWGGSIPASPEVVASYLADRADTLAVATLVRHLASISKAHEARGLPNPTRSELVRATMRGIKRTRGCAASSSSSRDRPRSRSAEKARCSAPARHCLSLLGRRRR